MSKEDQELLMDVKCKINGKEYKVLTRSISEPDPNKFLIKLKIAEGKKVSNMELEFLYAETVEILEDSDNGRPEEKEETDSI